MIDTKERKQIRERADALEVLELLERTVRDGKPTRRYWRLAFFNGNDITATIRSNDPKGEPESASLEMLTCFLDQHIAQAVQAAMEELSEFIRHEIEYHKTEAHPLSWTVRPERKMPNTQDMDRVWAEDECTTHDLDHETLPMAFERLFGRPFVIEDALLTEEHGDADYRLMPGGIVAISSYPAATEIYVPRDKEGAP
jgi:hypothetical protein